MARPVNAPMISKLLKAGGIPKAGRYTAWGYVGPDGRGQDGFLVIGPRVFQQQNAAAGRPADLSVSVAFTTRGDTARRQYEQAIATLSAEGYVIKERRNVGLGGDYGFDVIGRNDA